MTKTAPSLHRVVFILFAMLSLIAMAGTGGCKRDPATLKQKALENGNREYDRGKYPEAIIYYGQALQIDRHFAEAHYKLAQCYLKQGSFAAAFQELARTVDLQPDNMPAQLNLGQLLLRGGKGKEAKERALLILRSDPKNIDARILLAGADVELGDKEALQEAQETARMAPDRPDVYMQIALIQAKNGAWSESETNLKKAASLDSKSVGALMTLGSFYEQRRRWPEALEQFNSAIARDPKNPAPRAAVATV